MQLNRCMQILKAANAFGVSCIATFVDMDFITFPSYVDKAWHIYKLKKYDICTSLWYMWKTDRYAENCKEILAATL